MFLVLVGIVTSMRFLSRVVCSLACLSLLMASSAAAAARPAAFPETVSPQDLTRAYAEAAAGGKKVRILIVPGHEPTYGGTEFMGFYERELVLSLAQQLKKELQADKNIEVLVARDASGWNADLARYFIKQKKEIERFFATHLKEMKKFEKGRPKSTDQIEHNEARTDVALRLYGITKWAQEHDVDLMLHLHLNDEVGHAQNQRGEQSGVAVYVPDAVYGNARASRVLGQAVFERLNAFSATSTLPIEDQGVVPDRDLIALGAQNTSEIPSVLIEYGYIYEPTFTGSGARLAAFKDLAYQTMLGVRDALAGRQAVTYETRSLPYVWTEGPPSANSIYALQALLHTQGFYPPTGMSLADCPVSGVFGPCTQTALKRFQAAQGIEQTGSVGPKTRAALNRVQE